jgi:maleate isomerase
MYSAARLRAKWGVVIPSTNVMVEHDFAALCPAGVTFHSGRAYISQPSMASDADAKALLDQMDASFGIALRDVLTVQPDRIVIAMSAEVMRRGISGGAEFVDGVAQRAGLPVTTGPEAVLAGLTRLGVQRIGLLTPYQPESDALTTEYFRDSGYHVAYTAGLRCTSATDIAEVSAERIVAGLRAIEQAKVEAIVQVGTNLPGLALCAQAEQWLGLPTISMNSATVWWALRSAGIADQRQDAGVLWREH